MPYSSSSNTTTSDSAEQQQPRTTNEVIASNDKKLIPQLEAVRGHFPAEAINTLLSHHKVPHLDAGQLTDLSQYLFTDATLAIRFAVAEAVYIYDHDHPNALDIFLCCAVPLAEKYARRRAYRVFVSPSDWQFELMYDGAVGAAIEMFQRNSHLRPGDYAFRRYLVRALVCGALRHYFKRAEYDSVRASADVERIPAQITASRDSAEQALITRELLDQVTSFPNLRPEASATLQCIRSLGPDVALKEHAVAKEGDADKWKRERGRRPILNPDAIATAMKTNRATVHARLREARIGLRSAFNTDGRLFLSR
jgi:hypothetical protein